MVEVEKEREGFSRTPRFLAQALRQRKSGSFGETEDAFSARCVEADAPMCHPRRKIHSEVGQFSTKYYLKTGGVSLFSYL